MKFFLFVALALATTLHVSSAQNCTSLSEVLIHRAGEVIDRAEALLDKYWMDDIPKVVKSLVDQVKKIRELKKELLALEKDSTKTKHIQEVQEKLLNHENKLTNELDKVQEDHQKQLEKGTTKKHK